MVLVAAAAACRAGVALAMIISTPSETNWLAMVLQVAVSPEAFCSMKVTLSPMAAVTASLKPWVAASSASCCTSCRMPTVFLPSSFLPELPQAARERMSTRHNRMEMTFFI